MLTIFSNYDLKSSCCAKNSQKHFTIQLVADAFLDNSIKEFTTAEKQAIQSIRSSIVQSGAITPHSGVISSKVSLVTNQMYVRHQQTNQMYERNTEVGGQANMCLLASGGFDDKKCVNLTRDN